MKVDLNISTVPLVPPSSKIIPSVDSIKESENDSSKETERRAILDFAESINKSLRESDTHIQVKIHDKTNTIMVLVVNDETNEVIREIPREKMLDMMYNMCVRNGVFLDEKM
ncbi:flagellar protein FlaG [Paenibacillus chitinolyticus]|uniref:flagellar protein FlaG n=1 Tax=Paenibacillus chitinolyticus TaxID=79263 RepID=UPI00367139EA